MTKPNSGGGGGGGGGSRPSRSGGSSKVPPPHGHAKKPLRAVRALKQPDNSVLRPPLETSVAGLRQAVRLFETSTPEVVHLMSYECDIIYECRVCKNLFRSVANFISHKRIYCTRRFNHVQNSQVVEDHTLLVDGGGGGGLDLHHQLMPPTRITARQDLTSIVQQASMAQYYRDAEDKVAQREQTRFDATVHLQPIENTSYGVYQTYETPGGKNAGSLMKDQVSELQNIMQMKEGVTLGPDGKIVANGCRVPPSPAASSATPAKVAHSDGKQCPAAKEEHILSHHEHICGLCKIKFSSKKTLSHHTRNVHGSFRIAYTCPCCSNLFTNSWSVMRHLGKVHRKTNDQVRRLRGQIQKKQVHADKLLKKQVDASSKTSPSSSTSSNNNKRLADTPDNSEWCSEAGKKGSSSTEVLRLRCTGCRRQFERQAAFQSHTQICHKRKMASPKPSNSSEKRIGIQVRMDYCKNAVGASPSPSPVAVASSSRQSPKSRRSERHKNDACDRASLQLQLTPLSSRHSSKEREPPTTSRPKIDSKLKTKKIESISRLLMEAMGGGGGNQPTNCLSNGVKHCDDDNNLVPKDNDAGDKFSRSSRSSSVSAVIGAADASSEKTNGSKCMDGEGRSSRQSSRTRTGRLSSKDEEAIKSPPPPPLMNPLVVEVNGVHHDSDDAMRSTADDEAGQLSPSKEGVIRVLTRYQLKSICKKDVIDTADSVKDEAEESNSQADDELEQMQLERLREMFRTNILYSKTLQCLVCLDKMKNITELKNHVADHFGCNHFRCTFAQCSFVTYTRGECIRHIMRAHLKQNERHLAAGFIGRVDNPSNSDPPEEKDNPNSKSNINDKSVSTVARRKRSLPVKKDSPPKNGDGLSVKQEIADTSESEPTEVKAKGSNSAKRRKAATTVEDKPSPAPPLQSSTDAAQSQQSVAGKESGAGAVECSPPPASPASASASNSAPASNSGCYSSMRPPHSTATQVDPSFHTSTAASLKKRSTDINHHHHPASSCTTLRKSSK
ncbi:uncharacterized protein LOC111051468 isoform X2 [Nilaparvata lugens]|uniref:uncharacterized protein LOC111051468 isoform X2 n=1 Tax=Nilaparvata lugens TaxID=108931 RepID=UPI00193E9B11|nr:uncharacterized protein LOC111051468 isoform X2 [Nilaparvata lugens]